MNIKQKKFLLTILLYSFLTLSAGLAIGLAIYFLVLANEYSLYLVQVNENVVKYVAFYNNLTFDMIFAIITSIWSGLLAGMNYVWHHVKRNNFVLSIVNIATALTIIVTGFINWLFVVPHTFFSLIPLTFAILVIITGLKIDACNKELDASK